jgi:hypothetical protein
MSRSSSSGKYKNASSLGVKSPSYNSFTDEWENTDMLKEMIERRSTNYQNTNVLDTNFSEFNDFFDMMQEAPNAKDAKEIAKRYNYDWKEIKEFLDDHPFERTHKGLTMKGTGIEMLSSKFIEDPKTISQTVQDYGESELQDKVVDYFSPRLGKLLGKVGNLLDSQDLTMQEPQSTIDQRYELVKQNLIRYFFQKPTSYQTPSVKNNFKNYKYHSSRFDKMKFRFY